MYTPQSLRWWVHTRSVQPAPTPFNPKTSFIKYTFVHPHPTTTAWATMEPPQIEGSILSSREKWRCLWFEFAYRLALIVCFISRRSGERCATKSYGREEPAVVADETSWVRDMTGWSSRLQEIYRSFVEECIEYTSGRCQHVTYWI